LTWVIHQWDKFNAKPPELNANEQNMDYEFTKATQIKKRQSSWYFAMHFSCTKELLS